ncbi:class I SAM-dependent methyltransferase [Tessaracoccus antarcticus]|uniref:Class I SAM-dependent methyltransferase n=1 Tax=Tessaracoccus antarcticus TaxID=2479848 RepID=A0A3M0GA34_9ACTN|nr:class I SAM-dependent methyltransferase [Tessaracoccus antarcticus]
MKGTASEQSWERRYAAATAADSPPSPNVVFVDLLSDYLRTPGRALDLGSGIGGDALWLARRGWKITALDASRTAISRLRHFAAQQGVSERVFAQQRDITQGMPGDSFDLVYACYFHGPLQIDRDAVLHRASDLLGVGGTLIVIDHASAAPWSEWPAGHRFPGPSETYGLIGLGSDWNPVLLANHDHSATGPGGADRIRDRQHRRRSTDQGASVLCQNGARGFLTSSRRPPPQTHHNGTHRLLSKRSVNLAPAMDVLGHLESDIRALDELPAGQGRGTGPDRNP